MFIITNIIIIILYYVCVVYTYTHIHIHIHIHIHNIYIYIYIMIDRPPRLEPSPHKSSIRPQVLNPLRNPEVAVRASGARLKIFVCSR